MGNPYMSNEKNLGWLGYIRDYTTQLYRDYIINHEIRIPINHPVLYMKVGPGFFRGSYRLWESPITCGYLWVFSSPRVVGLISQWFPLIRPAIKPLFLKGVD